MPPYDTTLTDDFLCHYVMVFRASPALTVPVASVHTPGYERMGNWPVGCWVTTLGIYINTSGEDEEGVGAVRVYSTSTQISLMYILSVTFIHLNYFQRVWPLQQKAKLRLYAYQWNNLHYTFFCTCWFTGMDYWYTPPLNKAIIIVISYTCAFTATTCQNVYSEVYL